MQRFTRSHPSSGCQWRPFCLSVLGVAPRTNKGLSSARLYENLTNSSSTCETRYHLQSYKKGMCVQSFTRSHPCSGCQWRPLCIASRTNKVPSSARLYENMTNSSPSCELDIIIIIYIRNACATFHKVAPMFRLLMEATLLYISCCCTKK